SGARVTKAGTGALTLTGVNTYTGPTRIARGQLIVQGGNAIPDTSAVVFGSGGFGAVGTTFDLAGFSEAVGSIGGLGGVVNVGTGKLTVGGDNYNMDSGATVAGSGLIVKNGTGIQGFTATTPASTYTGRYVVNGGSLHFGADARMGAAPTAVVANYIT